MSLPYVLAPEAQTDYDEAFDYYDAIRQELGEEFEALALEEFQRVCTHPLIGTVVAPGVRRKLLRKFPYAVIYREKDGRIEVISVFHTSRDPAVWRSRIDPAGP